MDNLFEMMEDPNAYHIIIKFLKNFSRNYNNQIYNAITDSNFLDICLHNIGCSSIQKVYELAHNEYENKFNELMIKYSSELLFSNFGGFVIISLINNQKKELVTCILENILNKENALLDILKYKFSITIIEKSLSLIDLDLVKLISKKLINESLIIELTTFEDGFYCKFFYKLSNSQTNSSLR